MFRYYKREGIYSMKFKNTLLCRMIVAFVISAILPAMAVILLIPQYYNRAMTESINMLTDTILIQANNSINRYIDELEKLLMLPYMDDSVLNALYTLNKEANNPASVTEIENTKARRVLFRTFPKYVQYSRKEVYGTLVCFNEKDAFAIYEDGSQIKDDVLFSEYDWYTQAIEADGRNVFVQAHHNEYLETNKERTIFSVARLIKDIDRKKTIGILKIDIDSSRIADILRNVNLNAKSKMIVIDEQDDILYATQAVTNRVKKQLLQEKDLVKDGKEEFSVTRFAIDGTDWNIHVLISKSDYNAQINKVKQTVISIYFLVLVVAALLYAYLSKRITIPLKIIRKKMKQVEQGDFSVRFHSKHLDEIGELGDSFNEMTIKLDHLIESEYKAVIAAQKAEYRAMQSQIEPHFIYNVLNGMLGINRQGDTKLLEEIIVKFSSLLRYVTEHKNFVTVREEISMVDKYCWIQKLRLQKRLQYTIDIDETILGFEIPKLILQPIVENAIIHGIEPKGDPGEVVIKGENRESHIRFIISDTGVGFDSEQQREEKSVGLDNVVNRLRLLGNEVEYQIDSKVGSGTKVSIVIKVKTGSES